MNLGREEGGTTNMQQQQQQQQQHSLFSQASWGRLEKKNTKEREKENCDQRKQTSIITT